MIRPSTPFKLVAVALALLAGPTEGDPVDPDPAPLRTAALSITAGLSRETRHGLAGIDPMPLVIGLITLVIERCQDNEPEALKRSAVAAQRSGLGFVTRWKLRGWAAEAIEAKFGDRRTIGRVAFKTLRDQLVERLLVEAEAAPVPMIAAVREEVLGP